MCKRGENIYKRRDGRWEGRYLIYQNGKNKYVSVYGKTCAAVREKLFAAKRDMAASCLPVCDLTVQKLLADWLAQKQQTLKASSYARYAKLLNTHLLPVLGGCTLKKLTAQTLAAFMLDKLHNGRLDKHGGLAPKTVADMLCLIKSAVKLAAREFALPQAASILALQLPTVRRTKPEIFNEVECSLLSRQITENMTENSQPDTAAILFCLNTGLRLGEVCALRWSDVDMAAKTLTVQHTVQRLSQNGQSQLLLQTPKTDAGRRVIPLTAEIILLLNKRPKHQGYIFGTCTKPLEPRTLQYRFAALLQKCGIRKRNFHILRHTFATRFIALGGDVKSLCEILGHANVRTTMQLYVHPSMEQKRADMELVSTLHGLDCA